MGTRIRLNRGDRDVIPHRRGLDVTCVKIGASSRSFIAQHCEQLPFRALRKLLNAHHFWLLILVLLGISPANAGVLNNLRGTCRCRFGWA